MIPRHRAAASRQFNPTQFANMYQAAAPFNRELPKYGASNPMAQNFRSGIIRGAGMLGQRTPTNFMFGMGNKSYGRLGLAGGLGIMAIGQAGKSIDRAQYGNYTGAALSAGMAGAAGAAAYSAYHLKSSYRDHLSNAASKIMQNIFR